jgi:hypothetical protein
MECTFDLLKKRFNILSIPDRSYSQRTLRLIMRVCIILHNMIIDDERDDDHDENYHIVISVVALAVYVCSHALQLLTTLPVHTSCRRMMALT